jgi:hypothetical protein
MTRAGGWKQRLLEPRGLALLAAILTAPALGAGLATEDYVFRSTTRLPFSWSTVNLFGGPDIPGAAQVGREAGVLPWLSSESLHLSFWRPLSSLTHQLDYRLLGRAVPLMHLESILLYALLVFLVARLVRRFFEPAWLAGLAALAFAIDDAHGHAVGWLSNRSALLAGVFGIGALYAHDRWRRDGARFALPLSLALMALALSSGEIALGAVAYIGAHALFLEEKGRRVEAFAPVGMLTVVWGLLYRALGHGTRGSGLYIDPIAAPAEYLAALPSRAGALLLGQLGAPPADAWVFLGDRNHIALAVGGFAVLVVTLLALGNELFSRERRGAALRFAAGGMLLSLAPIAATFPSDRTLIFTGLGASMLVARVVTRGHEKLSPLARVLGVAFVVLHGVVAVVLLPLRTLTMMRYHSILERSARSAYETVHARDERLVVLNAPNYYYCSLFRLLRLYADEVEAPPMTCLLGSLDRARLTRVDGNTLELTTSHGYLSEPFDLLYRSRNEPMRVGQTVFVGTAQAEVTAVDARGTPVSATFRFIWPLDSEKLRLVEYHDGVYRQIAAPKAGEERFIGR